MKIDELALIKVALEYAKFDDWRVREGINDLLKNIDADLADVSFGSSVQTKKVAEELNAAISDIESGVQPELPREDEDDDEDEIEFDEKDDDDEIEGELELDEEEEEGVKPQRN